jgi:hypothetical protein
MTSNKSDIKVRQAVGTFFEREHLEAAIKDLRASGFEHDQIGLLATKQTVEKSLGDIYEKTNNHEDVSKGPIMAYASKEADDDNFWPRSGGLLFAGSTAATGAVVATAAVLGGPLFVAAAAAAGVGAVGAAAVSIMSKSESDKLGEQVDQGHILLFVRVTGLQEESAAVQILSRHAGFDAKVYDAPD